MIFALIRFFGILYFSHYNLIEAGFFKNWENFYVEYQSSLATSDDSQQS